MNTPLADTTTTAVELEGTLAVLEANLLGLSDSLRERDAAAMERQAEQLHQALATAVNRFSQAARSGSVPPALRMRLARAGSQVAAQREALARATAALDRAIDVLLPGLNAGGSVYGAAGLADRPTRSGMVRA